jgi:hypothetical protein
MSDGKLGKRASNLGRFWTVSGSNPDIPCPFRVVAGSTPTERVKSFYAFRLQHCGSDGESFTGRGRWTMNDRRSRLIGLSMTALV